MSAIGLLLFVPASVLMMVDRREATTGMPPELLQRFDWSPPGFILIVGRIGLALLIVAAVIGGIALVRSFTRKLRSSA